MTKRDLIEEVVRLYPRLARRDAEVVVNAVFEGMAESLRRDERIEIRGFGSFAVKHRQPREGRNPKTGEIIPVSAKRVPFFKVGKELKLRVDGRVDEAPSPGAQASPPETTSSASTAGRTRSQPLADRRPRFEAI